MDAPIDLTMGMEKLECDFSLVSYRRQVLALFGVAEGQSIPFVAREVLQSHDGTTTPVVHTMRGKIVEMDPGTSKPGTLAPIKIAMSLTYYKLEHGGQVIHEVDVLNMVRVVNGVDVLAQQRAALGL